MCPPARTNRTKKSLKISGLMVSLAPCGLGGEGDQFSLYRPHSHTFADVQGTPALQAQTVRRASPGFAAIREQSSRKYGLEYGRNPFGRRIELIVDVLPYSINF
jgi:hypothetical protein